MRLSWIFQLSKLHRKLHVDFIADEAALQTDEGSGSEGSGEEGSGEDGSGKEGSGSEGSETTEENTTQGIFCPPLAGNGKCDQDCNIEMYSFDGGDCKK